MFIVEKGFEGFSLGQKIQASRVKAIRMAVHFGLALYSCTELFCRVLVYKLCEFLNQEMSLSTSLRFASTNTDNPTPTPNLNS